MTPSNPPATTLPQRIAVIREQIFGEGRSGLIAVSTQFSLPVRTWSNYEAGVTMPASIMLQFLVATRANPSWLLDGIGDRFLVADPIHRMSGRLPDETY